MARVESTCMYSEPQNTESRQGEANKLEVAPRRAAGRPRIRRSESGAITSALYATFVGSFEAYK